MFVQNNWFRTATEKASTWRIFDNREDFYLLLDAPLDFCSLILCEERLAEGDSKEAEGRVEDPEDDAGKLSWVFPSLRAGPKDPTPASGEGRGLNRVDVSKGAIICPI